MLASEYTNAMQNPEMNQNSSNQNLQQAQGTSGNNAVFAVAATFQALRPFLDENESLKEEALDNIADQCGYGPNNPSRQAFIKAFVSEANKNNEVKSAAEEFWIDIADAMEKSEG